MATVEVVYYKYRPLKNNELPLKISVCKDKKSRYFNLGISVKHEDWDFDNNRPKETCPNKEMLESLISKNISEIRSKIVELKAEKMYDVYKIFNYPTENTGYYYQSAIDLSKFSYLYGWNQLC